VKLSSGIARRQPIGPRDAESVIGLVKTEVIRRQGRWRALEAVEFATLAWVDWFDHLQHAEDGHGTDSRRPAGDVRGPA